MTLQQLRYITMVAEKGTISEAAKRAVHFPAESYQCDSGTGAGDAGDDFSPDE